MTYTYEDAVKRISEQLEKMKSAPPQEERDKMDRIANTIIIKIMCIAWATITILMFLTVVLLNNNSIGLLIILFYILCQLLLLFSAVPLYNNKEKLCKRFNKEYKELCEKYKYPFCSQKSYAREIITIIKNTDVYIIERNKTGMVKADINISNIDEPDHLSVTFYYYDGCDENFQPKYKTQKIKFI